MYIFFKRICEVAFEPSYWGQLKLICVTAIGSLVNFLQTKNMKLWKVVDIWLLTQSFFFASAWTTFESGTDPNCDS